MADQLLEWFKSNGGYLNPLVVLTSDPENGLYWEAAQDLEPGTVCSCPQDLSISILNVEQGSGLSAYLINHRDKNITIQTISYFFLAEQRLLGKDSHWSAYINALPKDEDLTTPLYFSEEDMKWLERTNLHPNVEIRRQQWREDWEKAQQVLLRQGLEPARVTWELFQWAASIFTSRSFISLSTHHGKYKELFPILWPVIDIGNHRPGARVEWIANDKSFELKIAENVKSGDQIYNNYAPKGNEELLMGYGFCLENNPFDEYALKLKNHPSPLYLRGPDYKAGRYSEQAEDLQGIPPALFDLMLQRCASQRGIEVTSTSEASIWTKVATLRALRTELKGRYLLMGQSAPPGTPKTQNQRYAKVYRDGQMQILQQVTLELVRYFKHYKPQLNRHNFELEFPKLAFITLPEAVSTYQRFIGAQSTFHTEFNQGLEAAYGTSNLSSLAAAGHTDMIWALWICAVRLRVRLPHQNATGLVAMFTAWITNLESVYQGRLESEDSESEGQQDWFTEGFDESVQLARRSLPRSIWGDKRWDAAREWGRAVVEGEVDELPSADGTALESVMCLVRA